MVWRRATEVADDNELRPVPSLLRSRRGSAKATVPRTTRPPNDERRQPWVAAARAALVATVALASLSGCATSKHAASPSTNAHRAPGVTDGTGGEANPDAGIHTDGSPAGAGDAATSPGGAASGATPKSDGGSGPIAGGVNGSAGSSASPPAAGATVPQPAAGSGTSILLDVARSSLQDVLLLHDVSVSLGRPNGLPAGATAEQATQIVNRFRTHHAQAVHLPDQSHVARVDTDSFAAALASYTILATQLETAAKGNKSTLPAAFATQLASADTAWKSAMRAIGQANGINLFANFPALLMPADPTSTVPPPPH